MGEEPVQRLLRAVVDGRPPPADGSIEVVAQPPGPVAGILAFAGHHVVAADVEPEWVHARLPPGDLRAPFGAAFVAALSAELGAEPDNLDVVLAGRGTGRGSPAGALEEAALDATHPRVARSCTYRTDARSWTTPNGEGLLIVARGLARRWEAAFEVDEAARGHGLGRRLIAAALDLVPAGEPLFLQIAPGNVPSLRAALGCGGFRPIGAEILFPTGVLRR
jgi:GNAT superfamily N-acetyltransferase